MINIEEVKKRAEEMKTKPTNNRPTDMALEKAADTILQLVAELESLKLKTEDLPTVFTGWNTEHDFNFSQERFDAAKSLYESRHYETNFSDLTFDEILYLRYVMLHDLKTQPNMVNVRNRLQLLKCLMITLENRRHWMDKCNRATEALKFYADMDNWVDVEGRINRNYISEVDNKYSVGGKKARETLKELGVDL